MQGAWIRFALALSLCFAAATAGAEDAEEATPANHVSEKDRVWTNYTREAAVVGKGTFRFALRGTLINKSVDDNEIDLTGFPLEDFEERQVPADKVKGISGGRFDLLGSYGLGPLAEIGYDMPFFIESIDMENNPTINTGDVGDLVLYGKVRKMISSRTAGGLGLEITAPTGNERKRLGTGETAFNPFISVRHSFDRIALGAHTGYALYTGSVPDVFNWSAYAVARANEQYAVRVEVSGRLFKYRGDFFNDVSLLPGFDFDLTQSFTIRPQGLVHLTEDAWEWGIGIGLVLTL
jgi:hypothetical protein